MSELTGNSRPWILAAIILSVVSTLLAAANNLWYYAVLAAVPMVILVALDATLGLYAVLFSFPMGLLCFDIGFTLTAVHLFLVITFFSYVFKVLATRGKIRIHRNLRYLFCFVLIALIGILWNYRKVLDFPPCFVGSLRAPNIRCFLVFLKLVSLVLIVIMVANVASKKEKIVNCLRAFFAGVLISAGFGVFQFISDHFELGIIPVRVYDPARGVWLHSFNIQGFHRINAMSLEPKYHAFYLAIGIVVAIFFFARSNRRGKILFGLSATLFIINLVLTLTRSVPILFVPSLIVAIWLLGKLYRSNILRMFPLFAVVCVVLLALAWKFEAFFGLYMKRISTSDMIFSKDYSETSQVVVALQLIPRNFLLGVGLGNFPFYGFEASKVMQKTHVIEQLVSTYLNILVETGVSGFLLFMLFFYKLFKGIYAKALKCEPADRWIALCVLACNTTIWILSLYFPCHLMFPIFYAFLGLLLAVDKQMSISLANPGL